MVKSFTEAFSKVLNRSGPSHPILSKYKTPEAKIKEQSKQDKEARLKKSEREKKKLKAYNSSTDVVAEKQLKQAALRGVVKLFNEIQSKQIAFKYEKKQKITRKNCK